MSNQKIDYLKEDPVIQEQKFVCMSFLAPKKEERDNFEIKGMVKVRGSYSTLEEANKQAKYLQEIDNDLHIFVGEVGKWVEFAPSADAAKKQHYAEPEMQNLMEGYMDNQEKATQEHHKRKDAMLKKTIAEERQKTARDRLRQKLERKRAKKAANNNNVVIEEDLSVNTDAPKITDTPRITEVTETDVDIARNVSKINEESSNDIVVDDVEIDDESDSDNENDQEKLQAQIKKMSEIVKEQSANLEDAREAVTKEKEDVRTLSEKMKRIKQLYETARKKSI